MTLSPYYPPPFWVPCVFAALFVAVLCYSFRWGREPLATTLLAILALVCPLLSMGWEEWLHYRLRAGWIMGPDPREIATLHHDFAKWALATSAAMGLVIIIRGIIITLRQPRPRSSPKTP